MAATSRRGIGLAALVALVLVAAVSGQTVNTVYVNMNTGSTHNNGTEGFPVSTVALAAQILARAYTENPDSVGVMYLAPGTYSGPSQYGQRMTFPVTIVPDGQVTFDCNELGIGMTAVYDFAISDVNFRNCTNGIMIQPPPDELYSVQMDGMSFTYMDSVGVFVEGAQSLVISNSRFGNCEMAAVKVLQNAVTVNITNSNVTSLAGLWIEGATNGYINNCQFSHVSGRVADTDVWFRSQAVRIVGGNWTISNSIAEHCVGIQGDADDYAQGGAFYFKTLTSGVTDVSIENVTFTNCTAEGYGGAAYFEGAVAYITDSEFTSNSANIGGAISVTGTGNVTITSTTFTSNVATGSGGAIDISASAVVYLGNDEFTSNSANDGNAIGCCGITPSCNATLFTGDENVYDDNSSNNPDAVENNCQQIDSLSYSNYQNTQSLNPGNSTWWIWLIVALGIFLVVVVLAAIVVGFLGFRMYKRSRFEDIQ